MEGLLFTFLLFAYGSIVDIAPEITNNINNPTRMVALMDRVSIPNYKFVVYTTI